MVKTYDFEEFRWHFLSKEVDRFDLRKLCDVGRYFAKQSLREDMTEEEKERKKILVGEEKEVREGQIVKILRIETAKRCSSSYNLKNTA